MPVFYLYTDPLRAESQIRRDMKFVISILFELLNLLNTSSDMLQLLYCLINWVDSKNVYQWFLYQNMNNLIHLLWLALVTVYAKLLKRLITTVANYKLLWLQISLNVKCMFELTCHCYCNSFYSMEIGVYNNYCSYFQISLRLILPTAWNTNFVSQDKWFYCSRSNVAPWEVNGIFDCRNLPKVNLMQRVLKYALISFIALGWWFLKYCIVRAVGLKKRTLLRYEAALHREK